MKTYGQTLGGYPDMKQYNFAGGMGVTPLTSLSSGAA